MREKRTSGKEGGKMSDFIWFAAMVVAYFVLQLWVLPGLGIST